MPGRPRKPTHLHIVAGTARPGRINPSEPKPRRERPVAPEWLSDKAKTAWAIISVILDRMGVLTEADGPALEGLCEAYADLREAREALRARGEATYETENGSGGRMVRAYPEAALVSDADRRYAMWLTKFGLTPADRSRVSAALSEDRNEFADIG